jgi:hypothetical protein
MTYLGFEAPLISGVLFLGLAFSGEDQKPLTVMGWQAVAAPADQMSFYPTPSPPRTSEKRSRPDMEGDGVGAREDLEASSKKTHKHRRSVWSWLLHRRREEDDQ